MHGCRPLLPTEKKSLSSGQKRQRDEGRAWVGTDGWKEKLRREIGVRYRESGVHRDKNTKRNTRRRTVGKRGIKHEASNGPAALRWKTPFFYRVGVCPKEN